jgi:hypothetical protein
LLGFTKKSTTVTELGRAPVEKRGPSSLATTVGARAVAGAAVRVSVWLGAERAEGRMLAQ